MLAENPVLLSSRLDFASSAAFNASRYDDREIVARLTPGAEPTIRFLGSCVSSVLKI
jgi:hypothetical protein